MSTLAKTPFFNRRFLIRGFAGFTMIEVLIVVTILALVGTAMFAGLSLHTMKARDSRRKADLDKLRVAFEHYYNDNDCYPPEEVFWNGGAGPDSAICNLTLPALTPYLASVPCDPTTGMPYAYVPPDGGSVCDGYRVYTKLENSNDKSIESVGCYKTACGTSGEPYTTNNYGIGIGAAVPEDGFSPGIVAVPSRAPTGYIGLYSCSPNTDINVNGGNPYCREYDVPADHGCGVSFATNAICTPYCYTGAPITCSD